MRDCHFAPPHCSKARRPSTSMNKIFIQDLRLETRIGVYEWEQHLPQPLLVNVEFSLPSSQPFASDRFADVVDYSQVVARLKSLAANHPHKLVERFAEAIADILRGEFGAPWARVSVAKLAPIAGVKQIGVAIERGQIA
jgi:dihydroneopterin aldolase